MIGSNDTEQRIAAYLDGAMSDAEMDAFEREMEQDSTLAEAVERLATNDGLLREAMGLADNTVSDAEFAARMGLLDEDQTLKAANDNPPFWRGWRLPMGGAIAAALALALTLTMQGGGPMGPMSTALEATPSGQFASLDGDAQLQPVLTFRAGDGRYCREFLLSDAQGARSGLACRGSSDWIIEAWGDGAAQLPDAGEIALASGAQEQTLDEAYSKLDASDPLQVELEQRLISEGWPTE